MKSKTRKSLNKKRIGKGLKRGRKLKERQCIICGSMYVPKTKAKTLYCSIDCNDKSRQRYYMKNILENRYIHPYEKEPLTLKIVNKIIYDIKH